MHVRDVSDTCVMYPIGSMSRSGKENIESSGVTTSLMSSLNVSMGPCGGESRSVDLRVSKRGKGSEIII